VKYHWELEVFARLTDAKGLRYKLAREGRQKVFELSKAFPKEEMYSLTD